MVRQSRIRVNRGFFLSIIHMQTGGAFDGRDIVLPVFRGTTFRYGPEFRGSPENNGTGFFYIEISV
jgi:hypothetical protein